jgi:hypothetical protein
MQETGRPTFEVRARGVDAFSSNHDDLLIFLREAQSGATQLLCRIRYPVRGWRHASPAAGLR